MSVKLVTSHGTIQINLGVFDYADGRIWTVTPGDGGAGGSFSPPTVPLGDISTPYSSALVIYTAPAQAGQVAFDFSSNTVGNAVLAFRYVPASLAVLPATRKDAFLGFFE